MVKKVKAHKAGFVTSGANIKPEASLRSVLELMNVQWPFNHSRDNRR